MENISQGSLTPEDYKILKLILKKNPGITNAEVIEVFEKYKQDVEEWKKEETDSTPMNIRIPLGLSDWALYFFFALILIGLGTLIFNVFGFIIGLAIVMASLYWLETRG